MSMETPKPGLIAWQDLTVEDAEGVRDFYSAVVGWRAEPVDMGGYSDYTMFPPDGDSPTVGICHARGPNAGIPPQWLLYFLVADMDASLAAVTNGGGEVVDGPRDLGPDRFAVVRDPAGAVCALFEKA